MTPITVQKGSILVYRVFDIAEEINLANVEQILRQAHGDLRLKLAPKSRDAVVVRNAPVRFGLGDVEFSHKNQIFKAEAFGTLWDYGALSICFQITLPAGLKWNELRQWSAELTAVSDWSKQIDIAARKHCDKLVILLKPALDHPQTWNVSEDYLIFFFENISGIQKTRDLLDQGELSELIVGEAQAELSGSSRENILQNVFQYSENDFTVIDWNSAVVYEPSGEREIVYILEFALTHLLELRFYDDLIDKRLKELYDSIELGRSKILGRSLANLSHEANARYIEFSEFTERMGNSLKVVGDFYLARIFRGAIRRFRVSDWQDNISRKMNVLAQVSELLQGEANVRRSHLLESIIILLILFEIVSALLKG